MAFENDQNYMEETPLTPFILCIFGHFGNAMSFTLIPSISKKEV